MAAEIAKRDKNMVPVMMGVTNDANLDPTMFRVDPSTKRVLVDAGTITTSSASVGTTGAAVPSSADYIAGSKSGNLTGLLIGQQTMANSLAIVLASDQSALPASFSDGTNSANVLKGSDGTSVGQNALMTSPSGMAVSFTTTTVQAVGTTDARNYRSVSVQVTAQGGSSTITFQGSNDNTNWVSVVLTSVGGTLGTPTTSTTGTGILAGALNYRYFRLNVTGIVSGSTTGVIEFSTFPSTPTNLGVSASVNQLSGVAITTGNGISGTGVMRVSIASDSTGQVTLAAGTNGIGKLTANSGVTIGAVEIAAAQTLATVSTLTNQSQEGGVAISLNAGAVDTGTRRIVQANGAGKTILSTGGSASTSGNNTLVAAGTNRLKVFAFTLSTTSTTAMTCIFQSGAGGTELWRVVLQAGTGVSTGANLTVTPPAWLFATASATLLNLNLSSANAVHWSVSYFDEA